MVNNMDQDLQWMKKVKNIEGDGIMDSYWSGLLLKIDIIIMQMLFLFFTLILCKNLRENNLIVGQAKRMSVPKNQDTIYVHLVPHSHDDVGWLKTYEQYYYGLNNKVQWAGIQYTIDSVVRSLFFDKSKKFI